MSRSFHLKIDNYRNSAMVDDPDASTINILIDIAANIRDLGLDNIPTIIRDANGAKVGDITIFEED